MRERRWPRTVVRIVGSRALGIFPNTVGSSTRIGVRPVIGAPTVRLAEIAGAGCVAIAAAAAPAIMMRLRGRAAASGRPPPAVRAQHSKESKRLKSWNPMARPGRRKVSMTTLCDSSQIMLTEYPPTPSPKTVPLPLFVGPPTSAVVACRGQKHLLATDDVDAAIASHIDEAAPRLPSTKITALAARPLTAMHTWGRRRRHRP